MRRTLLSLGVALLIVCTLAPTLEVLARCSVDCVGEVPGSDCTADRCCSCCVHPRFVATDGATATEPLSRSSLMQGSSPAFPPPADPLDILHIRKSSSPS